MNGMFVSIGFLGIGFCAVTILFGVFILVLAIWNAIIDGGKYVESRKMRSLSASVQD